MSNEEQLARIAAIAAKLEQECKNLASWVVELLEANERLRSRLEKQDKLIHDERCQREEEWARGVDYMDSRRARAEVREDG